MNTLKFVILALISFETSCISGSIVAWGRNSYLKFEGVPVSACATGLLHIAGLESCDVVSVTSGQGLALCRNGEVHGWLFATGGIPQPPSDLSEVVSIASGALHGLALKRDGTVVEWRIPSTRSQMPQGLTNVIAIAAGFAHSLALRNDGTLVGWGGTITPAGLTNIVAIAATPSWDGNNLALRSDGTVIEWNTRAGRPSIVTGLSNVTSLVCGIGHQLALKSDGTVFGWGFNAGGEATGVATIDQPYRASGLVTKNGMVLSNVVSLAASETYNLALQANGTVVGWGNSGFKLAEVPAGLSNVVAIAAGGDYCLAVTTNSTVIERFRR